MYRRLLTLLCAPVLLALALVAPAAMAQSQDAQSQSIADAARRSRDLKKNSAKSSRVITDDDLAKKNTQPGEQGAPSEAQPTAETQPPTAEAPAATETTATATPPADANAEDHSAEARELGRLKAELAQAQKELDLDQRELALDQDTHFSNPDYQHDDTGKAKLARDQQQINDKQQEIDRLKTRIAALQELLNRAKAAASAPAAPAANPPATSQP
jgi:hypothetical protein